MLVLNYVRTKFNPRVRALRPVMNVLPAPANHPVDRMEVSETASYPWYAHPQTQERLKFLLDLGMWSSVTILAFFLRLEGNWAAYGEEMLVLFLIGIPVKFGLIAYYGFHRRSWQKLGLRDLYVLGQAVTIVAAVYVAVSVVLSASLSVPRSIFLLEPALALLGLGMHRVVARWFFEYRGRTFARQRNGRMQRVLIAGAGESGTMMAREMLRQPSGGLFPIGFLDDDKAKRNASIGGVRVLGTIEDLVSVVERNRVDEVLIAMPSEEGTVKRRLVELAREAGVRYRTLPGIVDILSGKIAISQIREVEYEDLLGRQPIRLEMDTIGDYVNDRTILVTGAGGSIGSELVRQLGRFNPDRILLLGRGENSIFEVERDVRPRFPHIKFIPIITDVRDVDRLEWVFKTYSPNVVFHAAAHKHVPMMECNPDQAIWNNVGGTKNLAELSVAFGVERFINVSTDKAVNPTSIMGASKRLAEMVVQNASVRANGSGDYVSVRFGNVLGSRGSVIPIFKEQIRRGGPVVVTHPEMIRYFMTIPEASQLVLQAGALGQNGSVYLLDMGDPVKIVDLARDLIRLSGLEPGKDVEIKFSGARPGEKLFEELLTAEEGSVASRHEKIYRARQERVPEGEFSAVLERVFDAANSRDAEAIKTALRAAIPTNMFDSLVAGDGAVKDVEIQINA
jgi:FlaA1/EpsC-like NDP-sugar epimerase